MEDRITNLSMTLPDIIVLLADGNPGAAVAMLELAQSAHGIDPDSALGPLGPLLSLDTHRIYGSSIWVLFKDICGQSALKMLAVLRAVQLGIASDREIQSGIAAYHLGSDRKANDKRVAELLAAVRAQLPRFGETETTAAAG